MLSFKHLLNHTFFSSTRVVLINKYQHKHKQFWEQDVITATVATLSVSSSSRHSKSNKMKILMLFPANDNCVRSSWKSCGNLSWPYVLPTITQKKKHFILQWRFSRLCWLKKPKTFLQKKKKIAKEYTNHNTNHYFLRLHQKLLRTSCSRLNHKRLAFETSAPLSLFKVFGRCDVTMNIKHDRCDSACRPAHLLSWSCDLVCWICLNICTSPASHLPLSSATTPPRAWVHFHQGDSNKWLK